MMVRLGLADYENVRHYDNHWLPLVPVIILHFDGMYVDEWLCLEPVALTAFGFLPQQHLTASVAIHNFVFCDLCGVISYRLSWNFLTRAEACKAKVACVAWSALATWSESLGLMFY